MRVVRLGGARCRLPSCWRRLRTLAGDVGIQTLVGRVPTVLIASRTETVALPAVAAVFYRPVSVGEIVAKVLEIIGRGESA